MCCMAQEIEHPIISALSSHGKVDCRYTWTLSRRTVQSTRTSQYAAQPPRKLGRYWKARQLFSVVAEPCVTSKEKSAVKEMWRSGDEDRSDAWWKSNVEFKMADDRWIGSQQHGRVLDQEPYRELQKVDRYSEVRWALPREAKEQKTREWQRPRAGTLAQQRTKEERARIRGTMPSSFAKSTKMNDQKKVRFVVTARSTKHKRRPARCR